MYTYPCTSTTFRCKYLSGIISNKFIGPYLWSQWFDGDNYRIFWQRILLDLMGDVPAFLRRNSWFQHEKAPSYFGCTIREYLDILTCNCQISEDGPAIWPPRSPDPPDFCVWRHIKYMVYKTLIRGHVIRILEAVISVREMTIHFERVCECMRGYCDVWIAGMKGILYIF